MESKITMSYMLTRLLFIQTYFSKNVHVCYRGCCVIALELSLKSARWATAISWRKAYRKYQKQISHVPSRNVLMTQSRNSIDFSGRKHFNYPACIRDRDCSMMLSESVKLSLATTLVQFWKSNKRPKTKPLVIKQNS
jgi:hypothetical protein